MPLCLANAVARRGEKPVFTGSHSEDCLLKSWVRWENVT